MARGPIKNPYQKTIWKPHKGPQTEFLSRGEDEILYGGARGGGKSDAALMGALRYVEIPDYKAIFFRRTFPQIRDLIDRARLRYKKAYPRCEWKEALHRFQFPSGAIINFSHMERDLDSENHRGREYHYIAFEELTYFTFKQYSDLLTCSRSSNPKIIPRVVSTTNPGGPGHLWVKNYFIDVAPPRTTIVDRETGLTRIFIPAKVYDNPTLMKNDPRYELKLKRLPEIERRMQLEGDWDVYAGQAFMEWNEDIHVLRPHREPTQYSVKFISMDWGYAKPFSIGWYEIDNYDRLYRYREWYGVKTDENGEIEPDVGIQKDAFVIGQGVRQRTQEQISYIVADPHCWDKEGHGGSIADDFMRVLPWPMIKANNNRIIGKNQVHSRLRVRADGKPGILFSENCEHAIRTLPGLPVNAAKEDVESKNVEDHAYDEIRYACMSQPTTEVVVSGDNGRQSLTFLESFRPQRRLDVEGNVINEENEYGIVSSYV